MSSPRKLQRTSDQSGLLSASATMSPFASATAPATVPMLESSPNRKTSIPLLLKTAPVPLLESMMNSSPPFASQFSVAHETGRGL